MRSFYYRPGRSAFGALVTGLLALAFAKIWYGDGSFIYLISAALMAAAAAKGAFDAMSHEPALKYDEHSIWIRRTWGGVEEVPWRDVHGVAAKVFTVRYMGIVPIGRTAYITITRDGGLFGARRLRVSATAMGLSPVAAGELVFALKQVQIQAVGETGAAMAGAGRHGWGVEPSRTPAEQEESSGFDPDAALARYLASKDAGTQAPAPAAGQLPTPQRPVFGRRAS